MKKLKGKAILRASSPTLVRLNGESVQPQLGEQQDGMREEENAIYFLFRHISKAIVGAGTWKATDFSIGNVLEDSTALLGDIPAYKDHWYYVGSGIGRVVEPVWQQGYINDKGQQIPAGINAYFGLNKLVQSNADLIEHLKSDLNPYDAASVGVAFEWEASHEFEDPWDFYRLLGETITDDMGNESMVRKIVTQVNEYFESSLVPFGADGYAKQLKKKKKDKQGYSQGENEEGVEDKVAKLYKGYVNLDAFSSAKELYEFEQEHANCTFNKTKVSLKKENNISHPKSNEMKFDFSVAEFAGKINFDLSEHEGKSPAEIIEAITSRFNDQAEQVSTLGEASKKFENDFKHEQSEHKNTQTKLSEAEGEVTKLKADVTAKNTEIEGMQAYSEFGKKVHGEQVAELKKLYQLRCTKEGKEPNQELLAIFDKADPSQTGMSFEMFGTSLGLTATCAKCGGTNVVLKNTVKINDKLGASQQNGEENKSKLPSPLDLIG